MLLMVLASACDGLPNLERAQFSCALGGPCVTPDLTFLAVAPRPADILFVVDNSCSMADEQQNLARNFGFFLREIAGAGDYRIGVVTTDVMSLGGQREGSTTSQFDDGFPNRLLSVDAMACEDSGIPLGCLRAGAGATAVITSEAPRDEQIALFSANVLAGSCGDGRETGLEGMVRALSLLGPNECNAGFLRADANLVVIIVSDEEDQAVGRPDVRNYVNELKRRKPIERIRVGVIVGSVEGVAANCNVNGAACGSLCDMPKPAPPNDRWWADGYCHNCSYYRTADCCSAESGARYLDFARAIENESAAADPEITRTGCLPLEGARLACLIDSICQSEFDETLQRIARDLISETSYALGRSTCESDAIEVRVGGKPLAAASYSVTASDQLIIKGEHAPRPGESIEVFFLDDRCAER